jgi:RNA polymerase sigma factor (sigma-70 family)
MGAQLRSRETPDDLVQSVAREIVADLSRFEWRGEPAFRHWLYTTAQRKLVDKARHVRAAQRSPEFEQRLQEGASDAGVADFGTLCTPSAEAASNEEMARIEQAMSELPEDYREAIGMQRLCGMDYAAIAIEMKRSAPSSP